METNEDMKACIDATPGSIGQVSMGFADEKSLYKLTITGDDGTAIPPTTTTVAAHKYPMSRPLFLVVNGRPLGNVKTVMAFMFSKSGQELMHKYHYLTLKELGVNLQIFE